MSNIYTSSLYIFHAVTSGINIYNKDINKQYIGTIPFSYGVTSIWANDENLYFGTTNLGVFEYPISSVSGSLFYNYSLFKCYPGITSNEINYLHGSNNFICISTVSGIDNIDLGDYNRIYTIVSGTEKCFQAGDGSFYYTHFNGDLSAVYDSSSNWDDDNLFGIGHKYRPGDGILSSEINKIYDLHVTTGTSVEGGNTIFLGTDAGATVIEEKRGNESSCRKSWFYVGGRNYKVIVIVDGARMYFDGTYADSGYSYRYPTTYLYEGDIGDGWYWILPEGKVTPVKMYCDMTTEGGGYDYYPIDSGIRTYKYTDNNSGKALGLDIVMPRSKAQWTFMLSHFDTSYFSCVPGIYKEVSGGSSSSVPMRDPVYYGTGRGEWRVGYGGRWWLRDTSYGEPNGDYTAYAWLGVYSVSDVNNITFNDGNANYSTVKYLCSTNKKP